VENGLLDEISHHREQDVVADTPNDWITERIAGARSAVPVMDAIASAIKVQLRGTMCERSLRPLELTALANTLLAEANNPSGEEAPT
jgi:hypothetical protein